MALACVPEANAESNTESKAESKARATRSQFFGRALEAGFDLSHSNPPD